MQNQIKVKTNDWDFIICGGGMSGLSLAYYLQKSNLGSKSILIVEPQEKNKNDRTWAFWESGKSTFESILYKKWNAVNFRDAANKIQKLDIGNYQYKLLRGIDFYDFVATELCKSPNIQFIKDSVISIEDSTEYAVVKTNSGQTFQADFVFDSTYKLKLNIPENHNLLQHFKGLVIRTQKAIFDPNLPEMMDFGIEQYNECRFMYVLPFDEHTAIVEYTLFTEKLLEEKEYDAELKKYISEKLQITDYEVIEDEFGIIPMSDEATKEFPSKHIVRIGTSGGYTNPATGYTVTQPINTNGNLNVGFWSGMGVKLKKSGVRVNLGPNLNFSKFADVINSQTNYTKNLSAGINLGAYKSKDKKYEISISNNFSYNRNTTSLNNSTSKGNNKNYFSSNTLSAEATVYYKKVWSINTDYDFFYRQKTTEFSNDLSNHLLNARLQRTFKKNEFTTYLQVRDILNQNIGISRNYNGITYNEEKNDRLKRYWMLGFTWDFKNKAPKVTPEATK